MAFIVLYTGLCTEVKLNEQSPVVKELINQG